MGNCICKYACFCQSKEPPMIACCAHIAGKLNEASNNLKSLIVFHEDHTTSPTSSSLAAVAPSDYTPTQCPNCQDSMSNKNNTPDDLLQSEDLLALEGIVKSIDFPISTMAVVDATAPRTPTPSSICHCHRHSINSSTAKECFSIKPKMSLGDRLAAAEQRLKLSASRTHVRVYTLTWNVNGKKAALKDLIKLAASLDKDQYDLFVVGLQEAPNCDPERILRKAFGQSYSLVATAAMTSLQLFIICRKTLASYFEDIRVDKVGGGVCGAIAGRQKGAVAVSLTFRDARCLFIASHLPPHESNVEERNLQFQKISHSLFVARSPPPRLSACLNVSIDDMSLASATTTIGRAMPNTALEDADFVVWLGDLNYRIQDDRSRVDELINQNKIMSLRNKDQLSREIERGNVFKGFREGPLSFRPTYKYDVGTDNYDTSPKERVPSWTDRILYKVKASSSSSPMMKVAVCDYDAIDSIKSSDHRPVKAVFTLSPW